MGLLRTAMSVLLTGGREVGEQKRRRDRETRWRQQSRSQALLLSQSNVAMLSQSHSREKWFLPLKFVVNYHRVNTNYLCLRD